MSEILRPHLRREAGVGLVELMVALVLSLFLLAGLFTIFYSTKRSYSDEHALAALQDNQALAASVLAQTVRNAGYFPYSATGFTSRSAAFPGNTTIYGTTITWASGQVVYATGTTAGPDTLYVRLIPSPAYNCFGDNATHVEVDVLKLYPTKNPHSLACTTQSASASSQTNSLVSPLGTLGTNTSGGGVKNMQVQIGVATSGATSINRYYAPSVMPANAWQNARSVVVKLTFFNPLFNVVNNPGTNCLDKDSQGQPRCLYMTRVISLENMKQ